MNREDLVNKVKEALADKSILITGASGFVGKSLIAFVESERLKCSVTGLSRTVPKNTKVNWIEHDLRYPLNSDAKFDYVIHAANPVFQANNNSFEEVKTIQLTTINIADFIAKTKPQSSLLLSSGAVYDANSYCEESVLTCNPQNHLDYYKIGKQVSENIFTTLSVTHNLKAITARGFTFSGKGISPSSHFAINSFLNKALHNEDIIIEGNPETSRGYLDSADMALQIFAFLCLSSKSEVYNLGSETKTTMKELAQVVVDAANSRSKVIIGETALQKNKHEYVPDMSKVKTLLGIIEYKNLLNSIKEMIQERQR